MYNKSPSAGPQNASTLMGGDGTALQHLELARPRRQKTHPAHTIILLESETVTHEPVTAEDLFSKPLERSHSEDLISGREKEVEGKRSTTKPVNGIALPVFPMGGTKLKSWKSGTDQAREKESIYQNGESPIRPATGSRKPDGRTCETTTSDRPVDYKRTKSSNDLEDKRNGYERVKETTEGRSTKKPLQEGEQQVTAFGDKSLKTSTKGRSSGEDVSKRNNLTLKEPVNMELTAQKDKRKGDPLKDKEMHEVLDHEYCNQADSPKSNFKGVNGATLVPNCQPGKQTLEESKQGPATSTLEAEPTALPKSKEAPPKTTRQKRRLMGKHILHKNKKFSPHSNSNEGTQGPKSESSPAVKASGEYSSPLEESMDNVGRPQSNTYENPSIVAPICEGSVEPHPCTPQRTKGTKAGTGSPTLLSIARSKMSPSDPSVAEAKDREKKAHQNIGNSPKTSTEPTDEVRNLHKEQRKEKPLKDKEMHELPVSEYCNRLDAPKSGFNEVNGAVLAPGCQPDKQTLEERIKETPTSNAIVETVGKDNKTHASLSPSPSPKPVTTPPRADRAKHHMTNRHTLHQNGKFSPHSDSSVMFDSEKNPDTSMERKFSPKSDIVTGIKASGENSVSLKESRGNARKPQQDTYENCSVVASTYENGMLSQPNVPERREKAKLERGSSTPVFMVHSEVLAPRAQAAEVNHQENTGQQNTRDNHQPPPTHYNKAQSLGRPAQQINGKSRRNPMGWFRRHRKLSLRASRSEETILQPIDLDCNPKSASQNSVLDASSSRSRHMNSPWRKFTRLFNKEPMPTVDVTDPAEEEQRRQESGLQNDPRGVKGKGEDIISK